MRAVLPGKPHAELQAISVGLWDGRHIIAYITGNAIVILSGPNSILQTIYTEHEVALTAVQFDEATGKIAACSRNLVHIYKPSAEITGSAKWSPHCEIPLETSTDRVATLSWGSNEELLVGTSLLEIYSTNDKPERTWASPLANPVKFAQFSYDASLIASSGTYDRLLKVWRRLNFASSYQRFDFAYLSHPATITGIHWRRPFHREQVLDSVLYTLCADNKIRIWASSHASGLHGLHGLYLWGQIDLIESISPRSGLALQGPRNRHAFIIDSRDFTVATERAVQKAENTEKDQQALAHLIEAASRNPEVIVVLDNRCSMSAWGLENIGCKPRKTTDIFNIAHVDDFDVHLDRTESGTGNLLLLAFCGDKGTSAFTLLSHHFDGRVDWFEGRIDKLLDPLPYERRLTRVTSWTGHSSPVKKINRTGSGKALVSRTANNESIVWRQESDSLNAALRRQSTVVLSEDVQRTCLLQEGDYIVYLHHDSVSLWDSRASEATEISRCRYQIKGKPLCLILLPETKARQGRVHVATVSSGMEGIAWEILLPRHDAGDQNTGNRTPNGPKAAEIKQFCTFNLGNGDGLSYVIPVDPAGLEPVISGFLDTFARDVIISYTHTGVLKTWTARIDLSRKRLDWLLTSVTETGIMSPSLASGSSIRKTALVDAERTNLSIWDTRGSQLEYEECFDGEGVIQDLDWAATPDNQSILAVGFPHKVTIYAQLRYDYLDAGPSWTPIRQISVLDITPHPIGDSVWLGSGNLVIGAGNQLLIQDEHVALSESVSSALRFAPRKDVAQSIFSLVSWLNGPLPVYHAQFLTQCILAGKLRLVHRILVNLYQKLKFLSEGDPLDGFLGIAINEFSTEQEIVSMSRKEMASSYVDFSEEEELSTVTEETAASFNELLSRVQVPHLSSYEQFRLADVVECVGTVEKHRRSIDENGSRFLVFFRQHALVASRHKGEPTGISWREIAWAYHSQTQDILVDLVTRHYGGKLLWQNARECGLFMWLTDSTALRAQFEVIARNEYTKTDEKNPIDCSLYYLALKKKAVLTGLWRMATWSREQASTQRLLANNFNEPRWKTAALKNAYALMGKRRFEYAAAFFLLAGNLKDAVSVLSNQMGDHQLAIAVARVYEGDEGPVLREFLEQKILTQAALEGNRWLATWAFWMLSKRDKAVRALVTPLPSLLTPPESPNMQSKLFLTDDPALVVLYKQLREKSLQTLRGATMIPPRMEWDFVIHTARLYDRMGCDILALDLVRTWEFLAQPSPKLISLPMRNQIGSPTQQHAPTSPFDVAGFDPRKLLRRRSSLVVADLPQPEKLRTKALESIEADTEANSTEDSSEAESAGTSNNQTKGEEKKPNTFREPDPNSLLDAFGF